MGRGEWGVTPYVTDTHPIKRGETRGKENVKRGEQQGERAERRLDRRGCLSKIWGRGQERAGVGGGLINGDCTESLCLTVVDAKTGVVMEP